MGKNSQPQTTTQTNSPPPQVLADYQSLVNRATGNANVPYSPYQGEQVAPLTGQTIAGLGNVNNYAFSSQPAYQTAQNMTQQAAGPFTPMAYSGQALQQYMNPYTQNVVNATQAEFNDQNQQQSQFLNSANISSGNSPFAGDRAGIGQAILANQQQLAQAPVIAGLNQANFSQALGEFNTQQQTGLQAQEASAQQKLAAAGQLGNLGNAAQTAGLQGATAQTQAGMIPQQEQQAIDQALMGQYAQSQAYPFQTTGWLGNLIEGTGSLSGGSSATSAPGPSAQSQGIGLGTAALGLLSSIPWPSDIRLKEDVQPIGKTFDGQTIYRFRYKNDPRTQVGLIGQEVERKHPGAVSHAGLGSMRLVDYKSATESAAKRGHFQDGGITSTPRPGFAQITPQMALAMLGNRGASIGLNPQSIAANAYTPEGILARQGFQGGGQAPFSYPASPDPFIDFGAPAAIASGVGAPYPLSGVAALEYYAATNGGKGVSGSSLGTGAPGGTLMPESATPGPTVAWQPNLYQGYEAPTYAAGNPVVPNFSPFASNTFGGVTSGTPGVAFQTTQPNAGVNPYLGATLKSLTGGSVVNPGDNPTGGTAPSGTNTPTTTTSTTPTSNAPTMRMIPHDSDPNTGTGMGYTGFTPSYAPVSRAAGGVIGQSGIHHAMGYVPQGHGLTGMDSQGQKIGEFGGMFGARHGFAGGGSSTDSPINIYSWVPAISPLAIGPGPPHPGLPNAAAQQESPLTLQQGQDIGKALSKIGSSVGKSGLFGGSGSSGSTTGGVGLGGSGITGIGSTVPSGSLSNSGSMTLVPNASPAAVTTSGLGSVADSGLLANDISAQADASLGSALADMASGGMIKRKKRRKGGRLHRDDGGGTGDGSGDPGSGGAPGGDVGVATGGTGEPGASVGFGPGPGVGDNSGGQSPGGVVGVPGVSTDVGSTFGNNANSIGSVTGINAPMGVSQTPGIANGLAGAGGIGGGAGGGIGGGAGSSGPGSAGGVGGSAAGAGTGSVGGGGHGTTNVAQTYALAKLAAQGLYGNNPSMQQIQNLMNRIDTNEAQNITPFHDVVVPGSSFGNDLGVVAKLGQNQLSPQKQALIASQITNQPNLSPQMKAQLQAALAATQGRFGTVGYPGVGQPVGAPTGTTSPSVTTAAPPTTTTPTSISIGQNIGTPAGVTSHTPHAVAPTAIAATNPATARTLEPWGARFSTGGATRRHFDDGGDTSDGFSPLNALIARGYSPAAAAGIVGNLRQESNYNPTASGDSGASYGLAQWQGDRRRNLDSFAAASGTDSSNPGTQMAFLDSEVKANPALYRALQSARTPAEAADVFSAQYERPNPQYARNDLREAYANQALGQVVGGGVSANQGFLGMRAQIPPDQGQQSRTLLPPEISGALMAAGLGMMAGRSPYAAVNIGQGGLEGMKYLQQERQLERQYGLSQAEIRHLDAETQQAVLNLELERAALGGIGKVQGGNGIDMTGKGIPSVTTNATSPSVGPNVAGPVSTKVATSPTPSGSALGTAAAINTAGVPPAGVGPSLSPQGPSVSRPSTPPSAADIAALKKVMPDVPAAGVQPVQATTPLPGQTSSPGQIGFDENGMWPANDPRWRTVDSVRIPYVWRMQANQLQAQAAAMGLNPYGKERAVVLAQQAAQANTRANELEDQYTQASREASVAAAKARGELAPDIVSSQASKAGQVAEAEARGRLPYEHTEIVDTQGNKHIVPLSQVIGQPQTSQSGFSAPGVAPSDMDRAAMAEMPQGMATAGAPPSPPGQNISALAPQVEEYRKSRAQELAKSESAMDQAFQDRQVAKQRLEAMGRIQQDYQTGAAAEEKADAVRYAETLGLPVGNLARGTSWDPDEFQKFQKNSFAQVFSNLKATMGGTGRLLVSEVQGFTKANANPDLQPAANAAIITQALGALDYEDQKYVDFKQWHAQNQNAYDAAPFIIPWVKQNPVQRFVDKRAMNYPYQGQFVPPKEKLKEGQAYMTPKGPMTWRAGKFYPFTGAEE